MYYVSLDNSVWSSQVYGTGGQTQITFGNPAGGYASTLTGYRTSFTNEIYPELNSLNKGVSGVLQGITAKDPTTWTGTTTYSVEMKQWAPEQAIAGRSRPSSPNYPVEESIVNHRQNVLLPPSSSPEHVPVTAATYNAYQALFQEILGHIPFGNSLGSDPALTWSTMQMSDDCNFLWWDNAPPSLIGVDVFWNVGGKFRVTPIFSNPVAGNASYALRFYASTDGNSPWLPVGTNSWIPLNGQTWTNFDAGDFISNSNYFITVLGLKHSGADAWLPIQRVYNTNIASAVTLGSLSGSITTYAQSGVTCNMAANVSWGDGSWTTYCNTNSLEVRVERFKADWDAGQSIEVPGTRSSIDILGNITEHDCSEQTNYITGWVQTYETSSSATHNRVLIFRVSLYNLSGLQEVQEFKIPYKEDTLNPCS